MATSQQFLVCDSSTVANFKAWAQPVSNIIRTFGWTNTSDTGQLNGAGAGNWAGVTTVPGSGAYYYEIFQSGDALTTIYLKLEYGNATSTNCPAFRVTIGTGSSGTGNLTGSVSQVVTPNQNGFTPASTTATYECDFSGTSSRLGIMMWRNGPTGSAEFIGIQRSLNSSGSETSSYVTLWACGWTNSGNVSGFQQTIHFTAGVGPYFSNGQSGFRGNPVGFPVRAIGFNNLSMAFNGAIAVDFLQPMPGYWDYPCTIVGTANAADMVEGVTFTVTNQYGQSKTYMPSKVAPFSTCCQLLANPLALCMEYD